MGTMMYGDIIILYRFYLHKLYLPFFAWYLVTLFPCYLVTLLLCYLVTLLSCYSVTLLPRYSVTLLLPCYSVSLFPWDRANILQLNDVAILQNHFHL